MLISLSPATPLILGSGSPRRREILTRAGVPFVGHRRGRGREVLAGEPVADYLVRVVLAKLAAVRARAGQRERRARILVADTSVVAGRATSSASPRDEAEALAMIGASPRGRTRC